MPDAVQSIDTLISESPDNSTGIITEQVFRDLILSTMHPIGGSVEWYGNIANPPDNWLVEDGTTYARVDYPRLFDNFNYSGSPFIVDADHFKVPDSRNRVIVGAGSSYVVGATGGSATASGSVGGSSGIGNASIGDHASHTHGVSGTTGEDNSDYDANGRTYDATELSHWNQMLATAGHSHEFSATSGVPSSPLSHPDSGHTHPLTGMVTGISTIQPYIAAVRIIRAK